MAVNLESVESDDFEREFKNILEEYFPISKLQPNFSSFRRPSGQWSCSLQIGNGMHFETFQSFDSQKQAEASATKLALEFYARLIKELKKKPNFSGNLDRPFKSPDAIYTSNLHPQKEVWNRTELENRVSSSNSGTNQTKVQISGELESALSNVAIFGKSQVSEGKSQSSESSAMTVVKDPEETQVSPASSSNGDGTSIETNTSGTRSKRQNLQNLNTFVQRKRLDLGWDCIRRQNLYECELRLEEHVYKSRKRHSTKTDAKEDCADLAMQFIREHHSQ